MAETAQPEDAASIRAADQKPRSLNEARARGLRRHMGSSGESGKMSDTAAMNAIAAPSAKKMLRAETATGRRAPRSDFLSSGRLYRLSKSDSMPIWRPNTEFPHTPRFTLKWGDNL